MEYLKEKVAYLKGLAEGLDIDTTKKEGKLLEAVIGVLDEFAESIDILNEEQDQMSETIDNLEQDLALLEYDYYDEEDNDEEDEEVQYYEVECPDCHETMEVDEDTLLMNDELFCPNCNSKIDIKLDEDDECSCGCGCDDDDCIKF